MVLYNIFRINKRNSVLRVLDRMYPLICRSQSAPSPESWWATATSSRDLKWVGHRMLSQVKPPMGLRPQVVCQRSYNKESALSITRNSMPSPTRGLWLWSTTSSSTRLSFWTLSHMWRIRRFTRSMKNWTILKPSSLFLKVSSTPCQMMLLSTSLSSREKTQSDWRLLTMCHLLPWRILWPLSTI